MPAKTILYGNILTDDDREALDERGSEHASALVWHDEPTLFQADADSSTVFVDLDDPRFANAGFLMSVATAGARIRLIGKAAEPSLDEAKRVAKLGVSEILSADQCLERIDALLNDVEQVAPLDTTPSSQFTTRALIGVSPQMQAIRETIGVISDVDFPSALILGPTGTGKSLISKILHSSGLRAQHNLVEVNCSAIPDELFESELFGHVKGAFTDAKTEKAGLFEYAQNGTLFLDEIGNLSPSAQAKLLKILEDKKLRKVGAVDEVDINVRVVTATNLDLEEAIKAGTFREDLYFRLNLLTIEVPPLCERPDDVPELVDYYIQYYTTNYRKPRLKMEAAALKRMKEYAWPGNVRELCNVIERAVLLSQSTSIRLKDISTALKSGRITIADRQQIIIDIPPQGITLDAVDQQVVNHVLNLFNWNKTEAARFLGISRPRLRRIIEAGGLEQNRRQSR
ncbi:MAG: sigma-54 dependent transcriptional regulator [candidate division Zixibacteria bacterium]|nr:sigma-54 dependent transcriptional regulator [candidate division Zixibacteria bacterium]